MVAFDLRMKATGMIVEHYMTFGDLIVINDRWLHKVFEAWRDKDTDQMTLAQAAHFERDTRFCWHANRELLFDGADLTSVAARSHRATKQSELLNRFKALVNAR
jgi:hypothetical protein